MIAIKLRMVIFLKQSYKQKQMQKFYSQTPSQRQLKSIIKIQRQWRVAIARKKFKKSLRQIRRKNFTASQLLSSEKTYCDDLKFIIKQVLQPSKQAIGDQQLHQILFCNITEIFMQHHIFLFKLQQIMKTYRPHTTQISKPLLQLFTQSTFQSNYTNYCYNYPKADKIMKLLTENNSAFKEILKKARITNSAMNLQSYMIKPVQRLCKYKLMLVEYWKCMNGRHPDFGGMKKVIEIIQDLVEMTNSQVEEFLFIERYRQLKFQLPEVFDKVPENKEKPRKLVFEFDKGNVNLLNLLKEEESLLQSIVVFSDFILLIPKNKAEKPIPVKILHMRKLENMKYFKNLLQIVDLKKYYTFEFKDEKQRDTMLMAIQTKTNYLIDRPKFSVVDVLGTERRESFFKFYTVYIVEIMQNGKTTKIYPRFKNLLKVQDILVKKNIFLDINVLPLQKESPHLTLKSKTIEKRKLHIRQFLERIINHQKIMEIEEIRETLDYYEGRQKKKEKNEDQDEITILLPNWQTIKVHLNVKTSKIKDLKKKIALELQFIHSSQFQIFQVRNRSYPTRRLMYDDESVTDIFLSQQSINLNPFADKLDFMFSRHYYLSKQEELSLYKIDFIRLELELSVIRTEILSYSLEEQLMITFMCLFAMYINMPLQEEKITHLIKEIGKKTYKVTEKQFRVYYSEVEKIVSAEEDELVTIPFLIIKILSNNRLYQCQQFQVEIHKKCFKMVEKEIPGVEENVILGIKLQSLMLLTLRQKHLIKTISYKDIQSMEMHPNGIIFKFSSLQSVFRIKTTQGYEISKLITIYRQKHIVKENEVGVQVLRN